MHTDDRVCRASPQLTHGGNMVVSTNLNGTYTIGDQFHDTVETDEWYAKALLLGAGCYKGKVANRVYWACRLNGERELIFRAPARNSACRNFVEHYLKLHNDQPR